MTKSPQTAFLFVPHRAGSTRDDRTFINTHLSHRAAERRKRGKSRPKSLPNATPKPPVPKVKPPLQEPCEDIDPSPKSGDAITTSESSLPPSQNHSAESTPDLDAMIMTPDPVNILDNKDCDPFSSTLIPMTAPVRALLHFNDEMYQPWGEGLEKGSNKRAAFINKFFQTGDQSLQDRTTGYAFLARLASTAAALTSNQQLAMVATGFKTQAYENLRQHLITNGMETSALMYSQMFSLLSMEIAAQNLDAAAVHAQTLQQLMQNASATDSVKIGEDLKCSVLWHECVRGSFSLGRPAFEIDKLLDHGPHIRLFASVKRKLLSRGLMPAEWPNGFEEAELGERICACVRELRLMSDLGYGFKGAPELLTEAVMKAYTYRATLMSSRLLIIYNDAQDYLADNTFPNQTSALHTAAATAIAARFWYRVATSHEWVDAAPTTGFQVFRVYGTHKPILKRLREAHEICQRSGEVHKRWKLWLWILYVGSLAERANIVPNPGDTDQRAAYFNGHLVSLARSMGIYSWMDVVDILSTFLYSDAVGVRSRQCFEECMKVQLNG